MRDQDDLRRTILCALEQTAVLAGQPQSALVNAAIYVAQEVWNTGRVPEQEATVNNYAAEQLTPHERWLELRAAARQEFLEHTFSASEMCQGMGFAGAPKVMRTVSDACSEFLKGWDSDFPDPSHLDKAKDARARVEAGEAPASVAKEFQEEPLCPLCGKVEGCECGDPRDGH